MNRKPILPLTIAMIVLVLLQTACLCANLRPGRSGPLLGNSSRSTSNWTGTFSRESEVKTSTIDVKPDMTDMTLDADIKLDGGTITLVLTDPEENVLLEKRISGPTHHDEVYSFEPVTGEWTLEMTFEDATGNYRVKWEASN